METFSQTETMNQTERVKRLEELLGRLNHIGILLSAEKNTDKLIGVILEESMRITQCDAGSIYVKAEKDGVNMLKFKDSRNTSRSFPFKEFFMPIDGKSISGYCASTGRSYNFKSMEEVPGLIGINYNDFFDKQINYKTQNMLVIPMKDIKGEIVGVLQLINKKRDFNLVLTETEKIPENTVPFTKEEEDVILSMASQTAILLERSRLMEEIQELFDAFVESMVVTIEKRDPTTSGHSTRVATYVRCFAETINEVDYGTYGSLVFTEDQIKEIYVAALLHDVGKIGVSESVLCKENRLTREGISAIRYRFNFYKNTLQIKQLKGEITSEEEEILGVIDEYCSFITAVNSKGFLPDEEQELVKKIANIRFMDIDGEESTLLTEYEAKELTVRAGNLTNDERLQMNQHASYTYQILKDIPWVKSLRSIPMIAAAHHEKLDGTGYPNNLKSDDISVQSKILAIIDIFEALTARDRPYKKAMPVEKALKILEEEAEHNHIDKDLFEIFLKEKVYDKCMSGQVTA